MRNHLKKVVVPFLFVVLSACQRGASVVDPAVGSSSPNQGQSLPPEGTAVPTDFSAKIQAVTKGSSCSKYSWKNRGRAPAGYISGMALSYARSLCRFKTTSKNQGLAGILSAPNSHDTNKDALAHYESRFLALKIPTDGNDAESLRAVYVLGTGLGMRESSGNYCTGWDTTVSHPTASGAEAGPFQTSYDSMMTSPELLKLYQEYLANPDRCLLNVFKAGASCSSQGIIGSGAGASYQVFNKMCPAFAAEYAMTLLRILRKHFGPINRQEAEIVPACFQMLQSVEGIVNTDSESACRELL